jgi:hypothetical protein
VAPPRLPHGDGDNGKSNTKPTTRATATPRATPNSKPEPESKALQQAFKQTQTAEMVDTPPSFHSFPRFRYVKVTIVNVYAPLR